jgi:uncharacterized protein YjeT (DUF2065 family)
VRVRWLLYLVAVLVLEGVPPHIPPRAAKDTQRDIARAAQRSAQLDAARRDGGVYEPSHKARGVISRALQRLRSAVGRPRK